jgi:adenine-specific DNA methylase
MSQTSDHPTTESPNQTTARPRRLIEDWLPITEIGIESLRERTPMTPFPAPNRLHVWFARRPLVASRAAVLASLLPADADRAKFCTCSGFMVIR